jgi:hypothetical protein
LVARLHRGLSVIELRHLDQSSAVKGATGRGAPAEKGRSERSLRTDLRARGGQWVVGAGIEMMRQSEPLIESLDRVTVRLGTLVEKVENELHPR